MVLISVQVCFEFRFVKSLHAFFLRTTFLRTRASDFSEIKNTLEQLSLSSLENLRTNLFLIETKSKPLKKLRTSKNNRASFFQQS